VYMSVPFHLRAAGVPLIVLAALLTSCAPSQVPSEPQEPVTSIPVSSGTIPTGMTPQVQGSDSRGTGWQKVAIDGTVRSISHQYCRPKELAAGMSSGGRPLLAEVSHGVARAFTGELPNRLHNGLSAVVDGDIGIVVTEDVDPARAVPATMRFVDEYFTEEVEQPRDARGSKPVWSSALMDGEGDFRTLGAVLADGRWELHAWQDSDSGHLDPMDRGHTLYLFANPSSRSVLTGSTESELIVAGAISDQPGRPDASPQLWTIDDIGSKPNNGRWTRWPLTPTPDGLTDVASWEVGWWVAGYRNLRPVVYDFDSDVGPSMPMPDTRLDPDHPVVYLADTPIGKSMVLATQSADGPTMWIQEGRDWLRIPAPAGKLSAASRNTDGLFTLIDGALWFRPLPGAGC
jgi:hypothetical protein